MRSLSIFLAAASLLTTMSLAQAETGSTQLHSPSAEQMEQAKGSYQLNDGKRAEMLILDGRLYFRIARGATREMLVAGKNRFSSRDGTIAIRFDTDFDGDRIVLQHGRSIGMQDTIRLAANDRPGRGTAD
ncbi:hypothetical protein ACFQ09_13310 [Massilia norwichensis]|uniref:Uncharacterized protein n=1 Tax=Massilia norwichensis TaxID=1442366 RepID=A0ABT2A691_9BURK|nr:hypothetical protein [Massilia norwichensis]MCS0589715.1 hypothetical protein [Massilia norwichensis]